MAKQEILTALKKINSAEDVIDNILNSETIAPYLQDPATAREILGHSNVIRFLRENKQLVDAFKKRFPATRALFSKKKRETAGCMNLEERIGEGGLGVVYRGSLNPDILGTYNHIKLAEMWAQISEGAGLYLPLKNGNSDDEDPETRKTRRGRNRRLIEGVRDSHTREELIDLISEEMHGKAYAIKFNNFKSTESYAPEDVKNVRRYRREFELTNEQVLQESENVVQLLFEEEESCLKEPEKRDRSRSGRVFYVMELLSGGDLRKKIKAKKGAWELYDALDIIVPAANALTAAHSKNIIHRDIKPENIMFTEDGEVRVTDFGLGKDVKSKDATALTRTGTAMGTPWYMPLEQMISAKHVRARADVYSLGLTLYEMLTGDLPFELKSAESLADVSGLLEKYEGREHEFIPFKDARPNTVEDAVNKVILKSIQINDELRYRSSDIRKDRKPMESFCEDLSRIWTWDPKQSSVLDFDMKAINQDQARRWRKKWYKRLSIPGAAALAGGLVLGATLLFSGDDPIGEAKAEYENEFAAIEKIADEGDYNQALERIRELDKKIASIIKTGGSEAKTRLSKLDSRLDAALRTYDIQTVLNSYQKRFTAAEGLEDPQNREEQIRSLISELEKLNKEKRSTKIGDLAARKQSALEDAIESRLEAEIKEDYSKAKELEQQGLLVEAFYEYERVTSEWQEREEDLQKEKVASVYSANRPKTDEIAERIWDLEGKDPAWRTLQFCVDEVRKRGDYRDVSEDEYHTVAVLLAKKVVEPLAQGSIDQIPVAVKKDGSWWKERLDNLQWETRRAPGDFVASLWECYQMFKGTEEEQKWLGYARKWMEVFKGINEDNIDAYVGKALLDNHFVAMEIDPDRSKREEYKQEIRRLCDLIVQEKWNEELGFLMHYMEDDETEKNKLYSNITSDVVALLKANRLFNVPEYQEKAENTLNMLLEHQKAGKRSAQIYNFCTFEEKDMPKMEGYDFKLGSIEMYIQYAEALSQIHKLTHNQECQDFSRQIMKWIFDNVNITNIPHYGIFSYTIRENLQDEQAQSYRRFGMQKAHRLLPILAEKMEETKGTYSKEAKKTIYTLASTIKTDESWQGISDSDTGNITDVSSNDIITGIKSRGITSNIEATATSNIYELAAYFKALRKK